MEIKPTQLEILESRKWIYGGLLGVCLTFFFVLLSSNQPVTSSWTLFLSALFFAIDLPIYAGFVVVEIIMLENRPPEKTIKAIIEDEFVFRITAIANLLLSLGTILLIFHFSTILGMISSVMAFFAYKIVNEIITNFGLIK